MRIAHVSDFYLPRLGGIEMHVHDLAVRQQAGGHAVDVVTATPGTDIGDLTVRRVTADLRRPATLHPAAPRLVGGLLRTGGYDMVHVHAGVYAPLALAAVAAAVDAGLPVVVTMHSLLSAYRPAYQMLKSAMGWSAWPVQWTAVSGVAAADLRRVVGSRREVLVLPNGIEVADWRVDRAPRSSDRVLVVGVMRLAPRKRPLPLLRMLRAARRRLSAMSTVDLQAVLVGEGGQRGTLERYLRAYRMGGWVTLPGRLSRPEIRSLYERADLFVAPAVLESFGIAALEARCAGLPVLARTAGGIGEFVGHDRHGLLAGSDAALVRDLVRLAADPDERERLAATSRESPPTLSWLDVLDRTAAAYASAEALTGRSRTAVLGAS